MPSLRILIADDESIIRLGLKKMLEELGYQVVAAAPDGAAAVDLARRTQPDLAILDVRMPRLDGLEAARQIIADRPIPIVLLTAYSDRATVERAKSTAILAYLVKPIKEVELGPTIEIALARFEEQQVLAAEREELTDALETRELVAQAKEFLMMHRGLTEREAFRHIHLTSRAQRRPMKDVARDVLREA